MIDSIHQYVPTLEPGAVGNHTIELRNLIRQLGLRSEIFAEQSRGALVGQSRPYRSFARTGRRRPRTAILYQSAVGSWVGEYLRRRPEPLIVNYHNITPAQYFLAWEPGPAHGLAWGRGQLVDMADRAILGVADSKFNEEELVAVGYPETCVSPVLFDVDSLERAVDMTALADLQRAKADGGADLLFVGRVAPHKAQHDLIKMFAVYRRTFDRAARLHIVGGSSSDVYVDVLRAMADELGIADGVNLTGGVSDGVLAAHYKTADAFVCLSEHEGFCIPLIEAMHNGVPIVAYAAAAVPETLGNGGLLLHSKTPALAAVAVNRVVVDGSLRGQLIAAGRARLDAFSLERSRASFRSVIERVAKEAG